MKSGIETKTKHVLKNFFTNKDGSIWSMLTEAEVRDALLRVTVTDSLYVGIAKKNCGYGMVVYENTAEALDGRNYRTGEWVMYEEKDEQAELSLRVNRKEDCGSLVKYLPIRLVHVNDIKAVVK